MTLTPEQLSWIKAHTHFSPIGKGTVCGFRRKVVEKVESGEIRWKAHPLSYVCETTDPEKITCPHCARWLLEAVGAVVARIENPETPKVG